MQEKCRNRSNHCIECTVVECANHSTKDDYCCLDKVRIVCHEKCPTVPSCVDCGSFVPAKREQK